MRDEMAFIQAVTEPDDFTDMSLSAQALYFHLWISADFDGFVSGPKRIQRGIGAGEADLSELIDGGFVFPVEGGAVLPGAGEVEQ